MSKFTILEAQYRIVTPMFCGGAKQQAELRVPSIKGALRFWWRSLKSSDRTNPGKLQEEEAKFFGSSNQKVGRSKVQMMLKNMDLLKAKDGKLDKESNPKGAYYLGYGLMSAFGELTRSMLPGGKFTLVLRCGPNLDDKRLEELKASLILLGTVGGIGSRSRKGYGSLTLTALSQDGTAIQLPSSPEERLKTFIEKSAVTEPEWTAWSRYSRVVVSSSDDASLTPLDLLDKVGREMMFYRSWGHQGKVLGCDSEKNFRKDHDLSKHQDVNIAHPKRVVFGLPHNYGKGSQKEVNPDRHSLYTRRASPLFIHIHQLDDKSPCVAVLTFLPSLFLPEGVRLNAFDKTVELDRSDSFWDPINDFLDRIQDKGTKPAVLLRNCREVQLV